MKIDSMLLRAFPAEFMRVADFIKKFCEIYLQIRCESKIQRVFATVPVLLKFHNTGTGNTDFEIPKPHRISTYLVLNCLLAELHIFPFALHFSNGKLLHNT